MLRGWRERDNQSGNNQYQQYADGVVGQVGAGLIFQWFVRVIWIAVDAISVLVNTQRRNDILIFTGSHCDELLRIKPQSVGCSLIIPAYPAQMRFQISLLRNRIERNAGQMVHRRCRMIGLLLIPAYRNKNTARPNATVNPGASFYAAVMGVYSHQVAILYPKRCCLCWVDLAI